MEAVADQTDLTWLQPTLPSLRRAEAIDIRSRGPRMCGSGPSRALPGV